MPTKKNKSSKVRDLKPRKDAKGGGHGTAAADGPYPTKEPKAITDPSLDPPRGIK
ncbi:MAG: hypothetical protein ABI925_11550 [Verrucomicrobiota bacterium]